MTVCWCMMRLGPCLDAAGLGAPLGEGSARTRWSAARDPATGHSEARSGARSRAPGRAYVGAVRSVGARSPRRFSATRACARRSIGRMHPCVFPARGERRRSVAGEAPASPSRAARISRSPPARILVLAAAVLAARRSHALGAAHENRLRDRRGLPSAPVISSARRGAHPALLTAWWRISDGTWCCTRCACTAGRGGPGDIAALQRYRPACWGRVPTKSRRFHRERARSVHARRLAV